MILLWVGWIGTADGSTWAFGPENFLSNNLHEVSVARVVDLDADGDLDLLCAAPREASISWFENLGGGVFGPELLIEDRAFGVEDVWFVDLDADGLGDLVAAPSGTGGVAWYPGLGGGLFGAGLVVGAVPAVRSVEAADPL